jgi:hypothetical protein
MLKMYELDEMQKIDNINKYTHHPQINTIYDLGNPIREKTQLEGEVALPFFLQMQVQRKRHFLWSFL